ncbi:MAG TPA: cobalamin-dependent protein [Actinospica sp.]|nr:cobalamin-dependent protein [Actinospica sp.]
MDIRTERSERSPGLVILGVARSDAHAVANRLIELQLRHSGYEVVNLGVCTPLEDFAEAHAAHPEALAVLIGSLNGHAVQDLADLPALRAAGRLDCPVVLGGNLSVGSRKSERTFQRLFELGVERIVEDPADLPRILKQLGRPRSRSRTETPDRVSSHG